jgi:hypothetical protein
VKAVSVKKEREDEEELPPPRPVKGKDPSSMEGEPKKASIKPTAAAKPRPAAASNSKTQKGKGILNFFGPKKT